MKNKVLLVGSIPGADATEAMRVCAEKLGSYLDCLPDGETGNRRIWINYLAATTYDGHPDLVTVSRPVPVKPSDPEEWRKPGENWAPRGYEDHWQFRIKPGVERLWFADLGYARVARESYADFCDLRDQCLIARDARFMVAIPLIESAIRPFLTNADDFALMWDAYADALRREVMSLTDCIPANDLVVQWDVCMEVIAIEEELRQQPLFPWTPPGAGAIERYIRALTLAAAGVPERTLMGLHLCYGDLGHRHIIEPRDLAVVTRMANLAAREVNRTIDYYHMPVPRDRCDDAYFEPLKDFQPGAGKLYLGLVHLTGGIETSQRLLATARQHIGGFGIAAECGFGRRPTESLPDLLQTHRLIADAL